MAENNNFNQQPQLTEQLASNSESPQQVSAVDYVYNNIKAKANAPSLLENIDAVQNDADYFSSVFNSTEGPSKTSFNEENININEAYTKLSGGKYITRYDEGFVKGADNEEAYAQGQTSVSKWTNGLTKFVGKTAVNVVGGTLGTAYGAISAIADGNWERVYDNEFYDFLDDQNSKMDNFIANYRSQEERDLGFFGSMGKANFWADDFLGGLSFMTGTIISEAIWASATGGASLTTTAARVGLRSSKYFNTAVKLTKGVREAQKVANKYNRLSAIKRGADAAVKYGKIGKTLNLARFTYTGAGFEAGMEARMYQKEQRESFNRDFERLNNRKATAQEIANFEETLGNTTNSLWATNMALVGTSNFAILGKTFGISSPFKLQSKQLNKTLFGIGTTTKVGESGQRLTSAAIKRNKFQKTLGFGRSILKNPFMEGFVEEGGQAASSNAMEGYLTSRYNPSENAMGIAESIYEGMSHTYGTKEGWKEVGLGALIGLVGGEGSNVASGQKLFQEAREALKDEDGQADKTEDEFGSVAEAKNLNKNTGTKVVDRIFATKFEENLAHATELENAQEELDTAEDKGSLMGVANAQGKIMLTSVKNAVDFDYLEDQIADFEAGLEMQDPAVIAEHYGIEESEVEGKIEELVTEYKKLGESYESAKEFAEYIISDNPKELQAGEAIDVRVAKTAIAYQMVMTEIMEGNMQGAHESILEAVTELGPQFSNKYMQALNRFNQINRSKKEDVKALSKSENKLKLKQEQLVRLNKQLLKVDQTKSKADSEGNQRDADRYNKLTNKIVETQEEVATLTADVAEKNSKLAEQKVEMTSMSAASRALSSQLDSIDPLLGEELVDQITLENTQKTLEELDKALKEASKTNPRLVQKITKLGKEYREGLEMWQRNADTMQAIADPELGLNRVGTMMQKKKAAGETTIKFLERLQKTQLEELMFSNKIKELIAEAAKTEDQVEDQEEVNEQEKAEEDPGEDILEEEGTGDIVQDKIKELKEVLKKLVGENRFVLDNFTDNAQELEQEEAPTQEELDEYTQIREEFKSGDINKIVGRPLDKIGKGVKERSGLTDKQITRYQELSQKMLNWRVVVGTNAEGVSIQDILNQIEAYEQELQDNNTQVTAEQVLEMVEQGQSEFSVDTNNPDYVNSMDKINIKRDKIQTTISHLDIKTIENSDFNVTFIREENTGTNNEPSLARVYLLEKDGESFEIHYTNDRHRIIVSNKDTVAFLSGMSMQTVKYNTKTGWGYAFKDGSPMDSDFGINLINNPEVSILNPQLIYELKPGDKLSFTVNMADTYINTDIIPLIKEGKLDEAKKLMSVYIVNSNGEVVGFLKAGAKANNSNFNKVREKAFNTLQNKLNNQEYSVEDMMDGSSNTVLKLPFEVEVEKTFVGTPNIELNADGSVKVFKITEEQSKKIVGFGYAENGKMTLSKNSSIKDDSNVRKTFIPKGTNTPYVIIQHGNTQIAFPIGLTPTNSTLQRQVLEILDSDAREQDKITSVIKLLKQNGVEPAQFNLSSLKDNTAELNKILKSLDDAVRTYSKEELNDVTKEELMKVAEIVINLDKPAFVSPKVKTTLSKKLIDIKTKEETKTEKLTPKEKGDLMTKHLEDISKADKKEDVEKLVMETGDEVFIKEFLENKAFKNQVIKAALKNKAVPSIQTEQTMENILEEIIDIDYDDIPLDIKEEFKEEVEDLKNNPIKSKIKALANKVRKKLENKYKLISASINTNSLYHIATTETEQQMFEQGYVRVVGDFYKKVNKKYSVTDLIEGLYDKYKKGTLPSHISLKENLTKEEFKNEMPNTLLDIYRLYYNTQDVLLTHNKAASAGAEQFLREDFKGFFAEYIQKEKKKGSKLYKEVMQHFQITDKGILKSDLLTREKLDEFESELGAYYGALLNYSLINKHIDLQEQPQSVTFTGELDELSRLNAVNNPNLTKPKAQATIIDDKTISFTKVNKPFIQHEQGIYEQVFPDKQGDYIYERIAEIDPNFLITKVAAPFSTATVETSKEIDRTKPNINKTEGSELDC